MKIFLTGATGILGKRVTKMLVDQGHEVSALSRSSNNDIKIKNLGAEPRFGNLFDSNSLTPILADSEVILHLATKIPSKKIIRKKDWAENDRIRIEGTRNLLKALNPSICNFFLLQSVTFIYGDHQGQIVTEDTPISKEQSYNLESAIVMEKLLAKALKEQKINGCSLRFGWFYSEDSYQTISMLNMLKKGLFPIIGNGDFFWNLIHADDAAAAIIAAIDNLERINVSVLNICDNEPVEMGRLLTFIASQMKAPQTRNLGKKLAKIAFGKATFRFLTTSAKISNEKAKQILDWEPSFPNFNLGFQDVLQKWKE